MLSSHAFHHHAAWLREILIAKRKEMSDEIAASSVTIFAYRAEF